MTLDPGSLTRRVKELALSGEIDLVGVASIDSYANAPKGRHPRDILPLARSVISLGLRVNDGVVQADMRAHSDPENRRAIYSYMVYGYELLNSELNSAALKLTRFLEREGHITVPIPATPPIDRVNHVGVLSHIHAAVAAGLGEFGWHGLLVTPQFGPRLRTATVVTSAPLIPDGVYCGPRLCIPEVCGQICTRVCPTNALRPENADRVAIDGKEFEYIRTKQIHCLWSVFGLTKKTLALRELPIPEDPNLEDLYAALSQMDPAQQEERASVGYASYCSLCVMYCPIGRKEWPLISGNGAGRHFDEDRLHKSVG